MPIEILGTVSHSRVTETTGLRGASAFEPEYIAAVARAHEQAGYDRVLIGHESWRPDAFQIAAYVLYQTSRLGALVAHRPGFTQPTLAARQALTLERLAGAGRVALHIITGGDEADQRRDGDDVPHDARYARTDEYLDVLKRVWRESSTFSHHGDFYRVDGAFSAVKPHHPDSIRLSFAGASDGAVRVGAKHADVYMLWGEPLAPTQAFVERVQGEAARHGRQVRFSVSQRPILGATEAEAWERAEHIFETSRRELEAAAKADGPRFSSPVRSSVGAKRLNAVAEEQDVADERLWLKYTRLLGAGGSTSALVGTPEQVAQAYLRYYDIGVSAFYIRGWNLLDDTVEYGQTLIPLLREGAAERDRDRDRARAGAGNR